MSATTRHEHYDSEADLIRAIVSYARHASQTNYRAVAVQIAGRINRARAISMDFGSYSVVANQLAGYLAPTFPALDSKAVLQGKTFADLVTIADAFELARWDAEKREQAANELADFYRAAGGNPPLAEYKANFLDIANFIRQPRYSEGLVDLA